MSKTIEIPEIGESITFDIWDTNGREKFKSMTRIFYQGAKMAILVYDITIKESFESVKNYWYEDIKEHAEEDIIIAIAGNKADKYDNEEVPEHEAREFAESIGAIFRLTSAQNNSGIDELFEDLAKKYLDNQNQELKQNTIKLDRNDVAKKNEEQKNTKSCCK